MVDLENQYHLSMSLLVNGFHDSVNRRDGDYDENFLVMRNKMVSVVLMKMRRLICS